METNSHQKVCILLCINYSFVVAIAKNKKARSSLCPIQSNVNVIHCMVHNNLDKNIEDTPAQQPSSLSCFHHMQCVSRMYTHTQIQHTICICFCSKVLEACTAAGPYLHIDSLIKAIHLIQQLQQNSLNFTISCKPENYSRH